MSTNQSNHHPDIENNEDQTTSLLWDSKVEWSKKPSLEERMEQSRKRVEAALLESTIKWDEKKKKSDEKYLKMQQESDERFRKMQEETDARYDAIKKKWDERFHKATVDLNESLEKSRKETEKKLKEFYRQSSDTSIISNEYVLLCEQGDILNITKDVVNRLREEWNETNSEEHKEKVLRALVEIKKAIQSWDVISLLSRYYLHLSHNVQYSKYTTKQKEIQQLEQIYRNNWKKYDPEWSEYLIEKFRTSLDDKHSFSILRFQNELWFAKLNDTNNIAWFLRVTPYKKSTTDKYASYIWAVNITEWFQGFSLLRYMLQKTLSHTFIWSKEVYLHAVPWTDSEKIWLAMGFEDRWIIEVPYGKEWTKKMPLRLMCLTKNTYKKMTEKN